MAITKRPQKTETDDSAADKFVASAPDAGAETETKRPRGRPESANKRIRISHTISQALLDKLDQRAEETGTTRASLMNLAIAEFVEK